MINAAKFIKASCKGALRTVFVGLLLSDLEFDLNELAVVLDAIAANDNETLQRYEALVKVICGACVVRQNKLEGELSVLSTLMSSGENVDELLDYFEDSVNWLKKWPRKVTVQ